MKQLNELGTELYKDAASPAIREIGSVAGRGVKALLAPIRGFLWCWERIEQVVVEGVQKKLEKVPIERQKSPDPEIAVPLLQSLVYTAQNGTLRELFIALLANSMDKEKDSIVHPSYVDIIRKMNRLDALLFDKLSGKKGYIEAINPKISLEGTNLFIRDVCPEWYVGWSIDDYTEYEVSASLIRLHKFGIIELLYDRTILDAKYDILEKDPFLLAILDKQRKLRPTDKLTIKATHSALYVNEYGKQFRDACR